MGKYFIKENEKKHCVGGGGEEVETTAEIIQQAPSNP
jgi:hypothetical protein